MWSFWIFAMITVDVHAEWPCVKHHAVNRPGGLTHTVHLTLDDRQKQTESTVQRQANQKTKYNWCVTTDTNIKIIFYRRVTVQSHNTSDKKCKLKTVHWLYSVGNLTANTWVSWNETNHHTVLSVPLCHAMHPGQNDISTKKGQLIPWYWSQNATNQVDSKQDFYKHWVWVSETRRSNWKCVSVFISKWATEW